MLKTTTGGHFGPGEGRKCLWNPFRFSEVLCQICILMQLCIPTSRVSSHFSWNKDFFLKLSSQLELLWARFCLESEKWCFPLGFDSLIGTPTLQWMLHLLFCFSLESSEDPSCKKVEKWDIALSYQGAVMSWQCCDAFSNSNKNKNPYCENVSFKSRLNLLNAYPVTNLIEPI